MTDPQIPPCPVCGTVPTLIMYGGKFPFASDLCQCLSDAKLIGNSGRTFPVCWENGVNILLGRAIRTHGITTISQLTERLDLLTQYRVNNDAQIRRIAELESVAPDPRVAVLEKKLSKALDKLAMVEQESDQRLSAIIGYSDQLLAMKEKYEPEAQGVN